MTTMQINKQPKEGMDRGAEGFVLDYVDLFSTIQGEGPFAGTPATFLRLAGCNLECPLCDTNYTTGRRVEHYASLVRMCIKMPARLVVITGGEPFRQPIFKLIQDLVKAELKVQVETNGTVFHNSIGAEERVFLRTHMLTSNVVIVCSPKTPNVHAVLRHYVSALKYIMKAGSVSSEDGLPLKSLEYPASGKPARPDKFKYVTKDQIYVQPLDEQDEEANKRNRDACVKSCLEHGYRLCLQVHKIVGLA